MREIEIYVWEDPREKEETAWFRWALGTGVFLAGLALGYVWKMYQGQI
jgi:hypothetical protein